MRQSLFLIVLFVSLFGSFTQGKKAKSSPPPSVLPPSCDSGCVDDRDFYLTSNKYTNGATWKTNEKENLEDFPFYETKFNFFHFLELSPKINKCVIAGQAIIVAKINKEAGACVPGEVAAALIEFEGLYRFHCPNVEPTGPLPDEFLAKTNLLYSYNIGKYGPAVCTAKLRNPTLFIEETQISLPGIIQEEESSDDTPTTRSVANAALGISITTLACLICMAFVGCVMTMTISFNKKNS